MSVFLDWPESWHLRLHQSAWQRAADWWMSVPGTYLGLFGGGSQRDLSVPSHHCTCSPWLLEAKIPASTSLKPSFLSIGRFLNIWHSGPWRSQDWNHFLILLKTCFFLTLRFQAKPREGWSGRGKGFFLIDLHLMWLPATIMFLIPPSANKSKFCIFKLCILHSYFWTVKILFLFKNYYFLPYLQLLLSLWNIQQILVDRPLHLKYLMRKETLKCILHSGLPRWWKVVA